ncbi:MAG TPA: AgmX/PglI C-terminal domain-containing protein [Myxococcota bacterium]|nr:AgmX/PglI C-terminal domain-containing protein [Myxococcota bacterium]HRY95205.1 AgmX/PglI C-terminal domain-containing protein [Myxococcota bacterium]HSA20518.1 AgmX/PglI C-terminal domain-containing protein [Myxococcota bacterium]
MSNPGPADPCLELAVLWGEVVLDVRSFLPEAGPARAGAGTPAALALREPGACLARFASGAAHLPRPPGAEGVLETPAGRRALPPGDEDPCELPADGSLTWRLHGAALRFRWVPRVHGLRTPFQERLDTAFLNVLLLAVFSAAALVATFHLRPAGLVRAEAELHRVPPRAVEFLVSHVKPRPPPPLRAELGPAEATPRGPRLKGTEGEAGARDQVRRPRRTAIRGRARPDQARLAGQGTFLLGSGAAPGLNDLIDGRRLGADLEDAIGDMRSPLPGPSGGQGGLALRGPGPGGGGQDDEIFIGRLPIGGDWLHDRPAGPSRTRKSTESAVHIAVGDLRVHGPLSMDAIRAVVHGHRDQVRYCYNQALLGHPDLRGKVTLRFVIDERGYVSHSAAVGNDTGDPGLAACVQGRVGTWRFPMPRGGGEVHVTYPFVFHRSK